MSGHKGMSHHQVAPTPGRDRIGVGENLRDPAMGAKVPRCVICGMPDRPHAPLLPGYWRYAARPGMDLTLCEPCVISRAPRYEAEPVALEDVA